MRREINRLLLLFVLLAATGARAGAAPPNVVVIFADDLGYGDLGCYGHPTIRTPNLDRMASEGQRWTNFYSASSVCTPSRAALLTGRLPIRSGMNEHSKGAVLFPDSLGGLPSGEITIAEILKPRGYATAAIGKWHLGHRPQYLPTKQGFDSYFGIPYSNDMDRPAGAPRDDALWGDPDIKNFDVPLMRNDKIIERPANQHTLTKRYTEEAVRFIESHKNGPFFLYLAHNLPHVPLFRSKKFAGVSRRGLYGDVVEEIDWSVGEIIQALRRSAVAENTLVVFTSDNGPWLVFGEQGGSAGLLREGKGTTWEGGMREPAIFWWPGKIKAGVVLDMGSTLDLLPTIAKITGAETPKDRIIDGYDLSPALFGSGGSPRREMFFYRDDRIWAARVGDYKAHYLTRSRYRNPEPEEAHNPPLLYQLAHDPSEEWNLAAEHPEVIAKINRRVEAHRAGVKRVKSQLAGRDPGAVTRRER